MPRLYRMTISSILYDPNIGAARGWEMHYRVASSDYILTSRSYLAKRGIENYQNYVYRKTGRWIPKRKIKVRFEREESIPDIDETISIETREMKYIGSQWSATPLPHRRLSYVKRKYQRRTSK